MSKEICYKIGEYVIAIDLCEKDRGCVYIGKPITEDCMEKVFCSYEDKVVNLFLAIQDQLAQCKQDAELIAMSNSGLAKMVTEKDHQLALTEKALELACEQIWAMSIWEKTKEETIQDNIKFFKDKAKECYGL